MAKPRMDLSAFVGKLLEEQDGDVLREGIRVLSQATSSRWRSCRLERSRNRGFRPICGRRSPPAPRLEPQPQAPIRSSMTIVPPTITACALQG